MYVHGGITASAYLDDLVKLDLQTNIWSTITLSTAEGSCPTARSGHVVVLYEGKPRSATPCSPPLTVLIYIVSG